MKAKEVMALLRISRNTLGTYIKKSYISCKKLHNGYYDYSNDDVYNFLNKNVKREVCIYAMVSTNTQKNDLENQLELLKQFCFNNGLQISSIYSDIASGISFETGYSLSKGREYRCNTLYMRMGYTSIQKRCGRSSLCFNARHTVL